jgi:3-hydroxyisobutyrate dehydrogenase-like beta-hydroxyacid dehydrogenase
VLWTSEGRSSWSRERALSAGLEDAGTLSALVARSEVIVSVCPPHAAFDMADAVESVGFKGLYIDANAISPATARGIAGIVENAGATFVDGGIIGPPPAKRGDARLYLSGGCAARAADLFAGSLLEAIALDAPVGAASALKMAYASWTKTSAALLIAVRALAQSEGIEAALMGEWQRSLPDLPARSAKAVSGNARKAWRFVGEMEEIAATFADAGLPAGFSLAAREIYQRLEQYKNAPAPPSLAEVASAILGE